MKYFSKLGKNSFFFFTLFFFFLSAYVRTWILNFTQMEISSNKRSIFEYYIDGIFNCSIYYHQYSLRNINERNVYWSCGMGEKKREEEKKNNVVNKNFDVHMDKYKWWWRELWIVIYIIDVINGM